MPGPGRTPAKRSNPSLRSEAASPDTSAVEEGTTTVGPERQQTTDTQQQTSNNEDSAAERRIKELQDQLAKALGRKDTEFEEEQVANPGDEENILVHFVRDGFVDLGTVWYKGQEVEIEPTSASYADVKRWSEYSEEEQIEYYGNVYYRKGPWKGKNYEDEAAAKAEKRRNRAAPRVVTK